MMERTRSQLISLVFLVLTALACTLPVLPIGQSEGAEESANDETIEVSPGVTEIPADGTPGDTPTLTSLPSPTPLESTATGDDETTPIFPPLPGEGTTPTPTSEVLPPIPGSFDVYIGAPDEEGSQTLRWIDVFSDVTFSTASIKPAPGSVIRAGRYIYYQEAGTLQPFRINTAGSIEPLSFATPIPGGAESQLLPSATGEFLAWVGVAPDGTRYTISLARQDGTDITVLQEGPLEPGSSIRLIRVTNDGQRIFFDIRPPDVRYPTLFDGFYEVRLIDTFNRREIGIPGEPACGELLACPAHVSPDGTYFARTLPQGQSNLPIVVTNLVTSTIVGQFPIIDTVAPGARFEAGSPIFTPGGELIYIVGVGAPGLERYQLVLVDLIASEQRLLYDFGTNSHRPLGWAGEGFQLLTTRATEYTTWQTDIRTGDTRSIAGLLFLGTIQQP